MDFNIAWSQQLDGYSAACSDDSDIDKRLATVDKGKIKKILRFECEIFTIEVYLVVDTYHMNVGFVYKVLLPAYNSTLSGKPGKVYPHWRIST